MPNAIASRSDVHRPSALVTEDYEYAYSYPEEGDRTSAQALLGALLDDGYRFGQVHGGDTCDHCGARLRYVAVLKHLPTRTLIKVGETCLDNRFALASTEFHRLRKLASLNRDRTALAVKRAQWFALDEDRLIAFEWARAMIDAGDYGRGGFRHKFVSAVNRWGSTSQSFVRAIMREMARTERIEGEREAERNEMRPVVEGKITVAGEVVAVKWQDNDYGGRLVMTVRDDRGFLVWGSVPRAIDEVTRGQRVSFTATVERSDRDETFGFYKRPSKATIEA